MAGQFSVTLSGVDDWSNNEKIARFLALTFLGHDRDSLYARLAATPFLLVAQVDEATAEFLAEHLRARGGTVLVDDAVHERPVVSIPPRQQGAEPEPVLRPIGSAQSKQKMMSALIGTGQRPVMNQSSTPTQAPWDEGEAAEVPPWEQEELESERAQDSKNFGRFIKGLWKK